MTEPLPVHPATSAPAAMEWQWIETEDMRHILRAMPKDARRVLTARTKHGLPQIFLAGGAIRAVIAGEAVSDWDFLGATPEAVDHFMTSVKGERNSPSRMHKTRNALTLLSLGYTPVQGIMRWCYADPERLLAEFDFTIAQAVMWHSTSGWHSLCSPFFYRDLAAKRLHYTSPRREEDAGGSMLRVTKFLRRGYAISPEDLGKVMGRMVERYEPGSGIPAWRVMTGLLREVYPLTRFDGLDLDDGEGDPLLPDAIGADL